MELKGRCEDEDSHPEYSTRLMFSLFILFWSVVRFSPRRSAAPPLPAILPEAAFKASIMTWRSACSKLGAAAAADRKLTTAGKSADEIVASKPLADLEPVWGGMLGGDVFVRMIYSSL